METGSPLSGESPYAHGNNPLRIDDELNIEGVHTTQEPLEFVPNDAQPFVPNSFFNVPDMGQSLPTTHEQQGFYNDNEQTQNLPSMLDTTLTQPMGQPPLANLPELNWQFANSPTDQPMHEVTAPFTANVPLDGRGKKAGRRGVKVGKAARVPGKKSRSQVEAHRRERVNNVVDTLKQVTGSMKQDRYSILCDVLDYVLTLKRKVAQPTIPAPVCELEAPDSINPNEGSANDAASTKSGAVVSPPEHSGIGDSAMANLVKAVAEEYLDEKKDTPEERADPRSPFYVSPTASVPLNEIFRPGIMIASVSSEFGAQGRPQLPLITDCCPAIEQIMGVPKNIIMKLAPPQLFGCPNLRLPRRWCHMCTPDCPPAAPPAGMIPFMKLKTQRVQFSRMLVSQDKSVYLVDMHGLRIRDPTDRSPWVIQMMMIPRKRWLPGEKVPKEEVWATRQSNHPSTQMPHPETTFEALKTFHPRPNPLPATPSSPSEGSSEGQLHGTDSAHNPTVQGGQMTPETPGNGGSDTTSV